MTEAESREVAKNVKAVFDKLAQYSEEARLDLFLSCYDDSPDFLHISSDGSMRDYETFRNICREYYHTIKQQKISTITEKINVLHADLAVLGWTGNIIALLTNGDTMNMKNYSVTNLFKKIDGKWKIIHSLESALPPHIIKKE